MEHSILQFFISLDFKKYPLNEKTTSKIHTCFTFGADADFLKNDICVKPDLDALGSLGDEGWYCVRGILWAANYELPKTVIASREPVLNDAGVIMVVGASLHWEDGKVATFYCSFLSNLTMDITAIGTKGTPHVHDFIIPHEEKEASFYASSNSGFDDLVAFIVYFKNVKLLELLSSLIPFLILFALSIEPLMVYPAPSHLVSSAFT
ncbi:hypothetical protein RIF29_35798 [Crotalaria pallida]|uniref:Uncharacterized protein n=1 Tax=Crotalaria pallida TaxID=3830 RepID=A0AAN9HY57_CROPI